MSNIYLKADEVTSAGIEAVADTTWQLIHMKAGELKMLIECDEIAVRKLPKGYEFVIQFNRIPDDKFNYCQQTEKANYHGHIMRPRKKSPVSTILNKANKEISLLLTPEGQVYDRWPELERMVQVGSRLRWSSFGLLNHVVIGMVPVDVHQPLVIPDGWVEVTGTEFAKLNTPEIKS
jgi:hypothetical protein